jgi:uroporphyrinogen-III synthase
MNNRHFFIVRSADGLNTTINRFKKCSDFISGFSVMDIQYLSPNMPVINPNTDFIFTSAYAVKSLERIFKPTLHRAFCVGEATAYQAKIAGFKHIITPYEHTVTALCKMLSGENSDNHYIYATGVYHKPYLENYCQEYQISVISVILYDAVAIEYLPDNIIDILAKQHHTIICFSARTANILYNLITQYSISIQHDWHIVGQENDINFYQLLNDKPFFYNTPQKLYDFFKI